MAGPEPATSGLGAPETCSRNLQVYVSQSRLISSCDARPAEIRGDLRPACTSLHTAMAKRPRRAAVSEAPALRLHLEHEEHQAPPFTIAVPLPSDPNAPNAARLEALVALVEAMRPREPWQRTLWSAAGILETELHRHIGARAIRTAPRTPEVRARRAAVARSATHLAALRRELERWPTGESEREAALAHLAWLERWTERFAPRPAGTHGRPREPFARFAAVCRRVMRPHSGEPPAPVSWYVLGAYVLETVRPLLGEEAQRAIDPAYHPPITPAAIEALVNRLKHARPVTRPSR